MRTLPVALAATVAIATPAPAQADTGCHSHACKKRVQKRHQVHRIYPFCNTWACVDRVTRKRDRREMRGYKRHPLPWCTWGPESGAGRGEWSLARYRQPNVSGGSGGGKFQILSGTWRAHGGRTLARGPVVAKPVHQERVARRIYATEGPRAWVNC